MPTANLIRPANSSAPQAATVARLLRIDVPVSVVLAERDMSIETILDVKVGTIVEFEVPFDAELTLLVANQPIAKGHAVKVGENFGVRLTSVLSIESRIQSLGRR